MGTHGVAAIAEVAAGHADAGQTLVAAPVLGRPDVAAAGGLGIVAAGPAAAVDRVRPILEAIGRHTFDAGERPEAATAIKLANNFVLGCAIEVMAEAFSLGRRYDVAPAVLHEVLTEGLFAAPAYKVYGQIIVDEDYDRVGFTTAARAQGHRPDDGRRRGRAPCRCRAPACCATGCWPRSRRATRQRDWAVLGARAGAIERVVSGRWPRRQVGLDASRRRRWSVAIRWRAWKRQACPTGPSAEIGKRLRARREEVGLSLRKLASRLEISPSALSQIETGRSRPSVAHAVRDRLRARDVVRRVVPVDRWTCRAAAATTASRCTASATG